MGSHLMVSLTLNGWVDVEGRCDSTRGHKSGVAQVISMVPGLADFTVQKERGLFLYDSSGPLDRGPHGQNSGKRPRG